jgi:uncharacterized membrane protein YgcG
MRVSAGLFAVLALFFLVTGGVYLFTGDDPAGAAALVFSMVMCLLIAGFLWSAARRGRLPADEGETDIADGAGDIGFFSPFSYWPVAIAVSFGVLILGPIISYWLVFIGGVLVAFTVVGLVFQYEPTGREDEGLKTRGDGLRSGHEDAAGRGRDSSGAGSSGAGSSGGGAGA